jgi:hypothetical protein
MPATGEDVMTAIAAMQGSLSIQIERDIAAQVAKATVAAVRASGVGVFQAVATLLAIRLLLMLALVGGFALAFLALRAGTYQAGGVLVAYAVLIIIPLVWLEKNPRTGGGGA